MAPPSGFQSLPPPGPASPTAGPPQAASAIASVGKGSFHVVPGQVTFLLPSPYGIEPWKYAQLLLWHIAWHYQLGVDDWLLYITDDCIQLKDDPIIQVCKIIMP